MKSVKEKAVAIIVIIAMALCIMNYTYIISFIHKIIRIVSPFIIGAIIAYLLTPLCNKVSDKLSKTKTFKHRKTDTISILITEIILIIIVIAIVTLLIPNLISSVSSIMDSMPSAINKTKEFLDVQMEKHTWLKGKIGDNSEEVVNTISEFMREKVQDNINNYMSSVISGATTTVRWISNFIFGIVISIFVLASRKKLANQSKLILKAIFNDKVYNIIIDEIRIIDKKFGGFFIGKLIDSSIVGVITLIAMLIMRMPYALIVSIIVMITNMIPIAGPFIGAVPSIIIVFSESPIKSLYFLIFIIVLQQIDGHIIGPKCIGDATGLDTLWVLFAIIFFGGLWGIAGMFIGVPLMAVIYDIVKKLVDIRLKDKDNKTDIKI
jgi:predicted PurR-regulated permease PerM